MKKKMIYTILIISGILALCSVILTLVTGKDLFKKVKSTYSSFFN